VFETYIAIYIVAEILVGASDPIPLDVHPSLFTTITASVDIIEGR
jgi:hypothetical protein